MSPILTLVAWLITLLSLVAAAFWLHRMYFYRNFPPGPRGWPLVGYLPLLGPRPNETLLKLSQKHGGIFGLTLGMQKVVVLGSFQAIEAALVQQADLFAGRPEVFCFDSLIKKRDIVTTHGPVSKVQRKFLQQTLKTMGFGSKSFENILLNSADRLVDTLMKYDGRPAILSEHFFETMLNISWKVTANRGNHDYDKKFASSFFSVVQENYRGLRNDHILNFMPYLRHFVPGAFGYWTFKRNFQKLWDYLVIELEEHSATYVEGERRDIIDCHLEEMRRAEQKNGKNPPPPFDASHMIGTIFDLFMGGTDNPTSILLWGILYLILHPSVQNKVQEELDRVVGSDRRPALSDKPNLIYMEAVIMEVQRIASVAPLGLFHTPIKDATLCGYRIPKGTKVITNLYGVHHDPKLWDDPDEFRPDRFLDSETNSIKNVPYYIPFSLGRRSCPGEQVTRSALFFIFSNLLQKFKFSIPPNSPRPSTVPNCGLHLTPKPFSVMIQVRH